MQAPRPRSLHTTVAITLPAYLCGKSAPTRPTSQRHSKPSGYPEARPYPSHKSHSSHNSHASATPPQSAHHRRHPKNSQKRLHTHAYTSAPTRLRVRLFFLQKNAIFCSKWFDKMILDDILCLVLRPVTSSWEQGRLIKKLKKIKNYVWQNEILWYIKFLHSQQCREATLKRKLMKNLKIFQICAWQSSKDVISYKTDTRKGVSWLKIE